MAAQHRNCEERRNSNEFTSPALDEITMEVKTKNGKVKRVPALHIGFATMRVFLPYRPPPSWTSLEREQKGKGPNKIMAQFAEASVEEWILSTSCLKEDLEWLLKLPHYKFWSQIAYVDSVHGSLHSYLRYAPRYYDLYNPMIDSGLPPIWLEVKENWRIIHQLVFRVFLRMSTFKESKSAHINPPVFAELIYNQYIFDIPTMMDLCVIYGMEQHTLLPKMIDNIFSVQPNYFDDLNINILENLTLLESFEAKLGLMSKSKMDSWFDLKLPNAKEEKPKLTLRDFKDVQDAVMYIVDLFFTIGAFIDVFPTICSTFHGHGFEVRLASFYEKVFPILEEHLKEIHKTDSTNSKVAKLLLDRVGMTKLSILKMFRDIVCSTCLQPILESNENSQKYVETFLHVLSTCLSEKSFICDYEINYPFEDDIDLITQTNCVVDETRTSFIQDSIRVIMGKRDENEPSPLYFASQNEKIRSKAKALSQDESDDYSLLGATASPIVEEIELESLISSVLDVFPDLGRGFIRSCLDFFNFESEKVINALLENSLPMGLESLDRNSAAYQPSVRPKQPASFAKTKPTFTGLLSERKNVFDGDEFDVFSKDNIDTTKIHKGKKTVHRDVASLLDDKRDVEAVKESYKKFEITVTERPDNFEETDQFIYDDEYDDTYDDTTTTAWADTPTPGDDIALGKKFTIPRVLRTKEDEEDYEEEEEEDEIPINPNRPIDHYFNQTLTNGSSDQSRREPTLRFSNSRFDRSPAFNEPNQSRRPADNSGRGGEFNKPKKEFTNAKGKPKGQGQDDKTLHARRSKEQHKGAYGNHNRKAQSDRKRNRGMIPT